MGSPGKVDSEVTDKEIQDIKDNAMRYIKTHYVTKLKLKTNRLVSFCRYYFK